MLCIMAGVHQEDSYAVFAGDAFPSRFHRCSSWTIYWPVVGNDRFFGPGAVLGLVLTCPLLCLTGEVGPDSTKNRGIAAVAVLRRWLTSLLHAATSSCSSRVENSRYAQCKLCIFRGDPPGAAHEQGCRARCVQRQALVFQTVQITCGGPAGAQVQTSWTCPLLCHAGALVQHRSKQWRFRCCSSSTRTQTCPLWCNDRRWSRRADNCGVPQLHVAVDKGCAFLSVVQVLSATVRVGLRIRFMGKDCVFALRGPGAQRHCARWYAATACGQGLRLSFRGPGAHVSTSRSAA